MEKISSRQTLTDIFNTRCDLDLEHNNPTFLQDTLAYDAVVDYYQTKFDCKPTSSLEDTTEIHIFIM